MQVLCGIDTRLVFGLATVGTVAWGWKKGNSRALHRVLQEVRVVDHSKKCTITTAQALSNLKTCINYPSFTDLHRLKVDEAGNILKVERSTWQCILPQWTLASHRIQRDTLESALHTSLHHFKTLDHTKAPADQLIVLEKLQRLLKETSRHTCWFSGLAARSCAKKLNVLAQDFIYEFKPAADGLLQPVQVGERYFNHAGEHPSASTIHKTLAAVKSTQNSAVTKPVDDLVNFTEPLYRSEDLSVQWVGHSCLLVQVNGVNLLVDPNFFDSVVPPGSIRHIKPALTVDQLPPIDVLMFTSSHPDHCDLDAIREMASRHRPLILAPYGSHQWLQDMGIDNVVGNRWWSETIVKNRQIPEKNVKVTFTPAQHWNSGLNYWGSWMIQANGKTLFCAGETGLTAAVGQEDYWKAIKEKFSKIDLGFLPITSEGDPSHYLDHEDALTLMSEKLPIDQIIPVRWGAVQSSTESIHAPIENLEAAAKKRGLEKRVVRLKMGQKFAFANPPPPATRWSWFTRKKQ